MDWYLIHFRSEDYRFGVVSRDSGHAGGGLVDFTAVVNSATGQNNRDLLTENGKMKNPQFALLKYIFDIAMLHLNFEFKKLH